MGRAHRRQLGQIETRPSTAANYRKQMRLELIPAFGAGLISSITADDVSTWHKASLANGHPTQTANACHFLCSVMNEAVAARTIVASPCKVPDAKGKPAPKHEAETTIPELREYVKAVPDWYRLPLMPAAFCALRSGEVQSLRVQDVDATTGRISIAQAVTLIDGEYLIGKPKTKAGLRTVYAPSFFLPSLEDYLKSTWLNVATSYYSPPRTGRIRCTRQCYETHISRDETPSTERLSQSMTFGRPRPWLLSRERPPKR